MDKKSMIIIAIIIAIWTISYAIQYNQSSKKSYDIIISEKGILFKNPEGKSLAIIMTGEDGGGQLGIFDKKGDPLVVLTTTSGRGIMGILNKDSKPLITIGANSENGMIGIMDVNGEVLWSKP